MIHDFNERLAWSERGGEEPFWDAVYRKAFPHLLNHMRCTGESQAQRMGIDRLILLSNGKTLYIDEKKRERVYNDILLEYLSVDRTGAPGWMEKDLSIDYLAYAFMPTKVCYLFPWDMLRRAWRAYGETWKATYIPHVKGANNGYTTWSVAVPIKVVQRAVRSAWIIDVSCELNGGEWN